MNNPENSRFLRMVMPEAPDSPNSSGLDYSWPRINSQLLRSANADVLRVTLLDLQKIVINIYQKYSELVALGESEERERIAYQQLFEEAPIAYLVTDWDGCIRRANREAIALLGLESDLGQRRSLQECISVEMEPLLQATLAQLRQQPGGGHCEVELRLKSELDRAIYGLFQVSVVGGNGEEPLRWQAWDVSLRKQTELALQQRVEREHLTNLVIQRIRQSLEPQQILHNTVTEVMRVLQADRVVIYSVETGTLAAIAEALQPGWRSLLNPTPALRTDVSALLQGPGEPLVVENLDDLPHPLEVVKALRQQQIQAMVTVPIMRERQLLGLLSVHQCGSVRSWQGFEVDLLRQLAEQVAIALQHSHLYAQAQQLNANLEEEVQRRTEQIGRVLKYESMLKRITDKVRDSLDQNQILQAAVQELTLVLGLSGCNAALYNLDENTSTILYEFTHSVPALYGKVARMEDSPEIYCQLKQGMDFQFCSLYPNPERGSVAMLACPIFVDPHSSQGMDQTVLGDLWLIHTKSYVFNESEIRLVQQVANQCAIAIRQARLYRAAQAQVEELERLNQLKDQFLSTVSHELRTPIANLKMALHMLRIAPNADKKEQYLKILESELAREADLINDLLDLQRMEESTVNVALEPIPLATWVAQLVEPFHIRVQNYRQTLSVHCPPDLPLLYSDPHILQRILAELLNNACKYTPEDAGIALQVQLGCPTPQGAPVFLFILRNQAEIPASELPNIFQKFYRVLQVDRYRHGGTGLGLALVQKLVEQIQGAIAVDSQDGWTRFTLKVPSQIA